MYKKLMLACAALAAFAALAVVPASASAANAQVCETEGALCNPVLVNSVLRTHIVAGTISKLFTPLGTVECNSVLLTGPVVQNTETISEGTINTADFTGTGEGGKCTSPFGQVTPTTNVGASGVPFCLKLTAGVNDVAEVNGNSCGLAAHAITFVFDLPGEVICKYSRSTEAGPIIGKFTTDTAPENSDLVIHVPRSESGSKFTKEEGGILCPSKGELEVSVTLETDVAGTSPVYVK